MSDPRVVTLELLRHGPPGNQLLSPLTQYMGLCGNHSAVAVTVPFEHAQMRARLNALSYRDSPQTRELQLRSTAQAMTDMLSQVPGLIAELAGIPAASPGLTHLRLILSAAELALLPFELANAPAGCPGAGQPLALQPQLPLCVTREVRRVSDTAFRWPARPRILFAAASPPGVASVPLEAHLLALRRVVDPWIKEDVRPRPAGQANGAALRRRLANHLVVLPNASAASLQRVCAEEAFTHVHFLAHGLPLSKSDEKHFGLALHDDCNPGRQDVVSGDRLAKILRTYRASGRDELAGPAVVTIASCDSSNEQGSVFGAGSSVAHALHEGGIPLVVGSQFPLSVPASVVLAEVLYKGLLWGDDPRTLLNDLRRQLLALLPDTHDWASLVAYAALPANLPAQLEAVRLEQSRRCLGTALNILEAGTRYFERRSDAKKKAAPADEATLNRLWEKIRVAERRLSDQYDDIPRERSKDRATICGLLASMHKKKARVRYSYQKLKEGDGDPEGGPSAPDAGPGPATADGAAPAAGTEYGPAFPENTTRVLRRARQFYRETFAADPTLLWALVEELSLTALLEGEARWRESSWKDGWCTARFLSDRATYEAGSNDRLVAHANLMELYLLALLPEGFLAHEEARARAREHARQLRRLGRGGSVFNGALSQIERYVNWFPEYKSALGPLVEPAKALLAELQGGD